MPPAKSAAAAFEARNWPLIGRDRELELIAAARAGTEASGTVISAPAGVGKSRLARHALQVAQDSGALVRWVPATRSAAAVPLGAFAGVLGSDVGSTDPMTILSSSVEALQAQAGDQPIVIGVDDAQLLDPTSAALVLHLATTRAAFVVATIRSGEPYPDAVGALWKDSAALRIDLQPIGEPDVVELMEAVLGGPVEQRATRWLYETSRGNVLYLRELLLGALSDGAITEVDGFWRLTGRPRQSQSLKEIIAMRLQDLTEDERGAMELLALGEPLRLSELSDLAGADAIEGVETKGLVTVATDVPDGDIRVAHPLYGEFMRDSLPVTRAHRVRTQLAGTLQQRAAHSPEDALRIARWLLDAGADVPDDLLIESARAANLAGDADLGARLAELALKADGGATASMLLARAHSIRNRPADAEAVLAEIEGTITDQKVALEYLEQRTSGLCWGLQEGAEAVALIERAEGWWPDGEWQRRLAPLRTQVTAVVASFQGAAESSEAALADPDLDPEMRRATEVVHVANIFYSGRTREAYDLLLPLRPSVPLGGMSDDLAHILWSIVGIETAWDFPELERWMRKTIDDSLAIDDHAAAGIAAMTLGGMRLLAGRYADSARWFAESVVHYEHHDPFNSIAVSRAMQVGVAFQTGDVEGAAAAVARMRGAVGDRELTPAEKPYFVRGEAWGLLAEGDPPAAQKLLLEGAEAIEDVPIYAAQLRYEALRNGAPAGPQVAPLAELRERCDAPLTAAYAEQAAGMADRDGAVLLRAAETFAGLGTTRYACECAAHAAEAFAADGRADSARRATARARELHALGQLGAMPTIHGVDPDAVKLTAREAQLVDLAARGLSNAEIADRLVLSVRTVESHIYNAMQKLGVSDRRDL